MKEKTKNYLKFAVKLALTSAALYFVFTQIDFREFLRAASTANLYFFSLAFLFYNVSKILSAYRIRHFYQAIGLHLPAVYNLKLYYVGMLYNLSLPGAIGGDGYKIYLLRQAFPQSETKKLIGATALDRISGLMALCFLGLLFLLLTEFDPGLAFFDELIIGALFLIFPAYYFIVRLLFPVFMPRLAVTTLYSFGVQLVQAVSALFILCALQVDHFVNYLTLFFASSVASVVPVTIGGAGARELVFFYGYNYLLIDRPVAIVFSLMFFIATVLSSLVGLFFSYKIDRAGELKKV